MKKINRLIVVGCLVLIGGVIGLTRGFTKDTTDVGSATVDKVDSEKTEVDYSKYIGNSSSISDEERAVFMSSVHVQGNPDAPISIIEFFDTDCYYCARHYSDRTLETVMNTYNGQANIIAAHYPLPSHHLSLEAAEFMECAAQEYGGSEAFFAIKNGFFSLPLGTDPTRETMQGIVETVGYDVNLLTACAESASYKDKVAFQANIGRKLGVTGTPGNIVYNNKTGAFVKVSGAVPASSFDTHITSFLQ